MIGGWCFDCVNCVFEFITTKVSANNAPLKRKLAEREKTHTEPAASRQMSTI